MEYDGQEYDEVLAMQSREEDPGFEIKYFFKLRKFVN